jgi:WD40 repeat protein
VFWGEGTRLATVEEGTVEIWDLDNNRMIRRCRKLKPIFPALGPCPMSFSCDGKRLAVVEYDRVIVYDLRNDEYLYIDRHETALDFYIFTAAPVFTRCGTIGVPCSDGTRLWATDGTYLGMLEVQSNESLCFSSDATQIVVIDSELNVVIWDATLPAKTDRDVQQCHLIQDCFMSSNGCELAIVAQNVVSIWDTQSGALTKSVEARDLLAVRLSEDFRWLAWTEYNDNMIRFWDTLEDELVTGIEARHRAALLPFFKNICFSHPGSNLVAIWSLSGEITIWDLLSRSPKPYVLRAHMQVFHEMGDCAQALVFSSSSSEFFLSHPENGIEVYDTSTGVRTRTFELPRDFSDAARTLHSLVLSDDGLRIVVQHLVWMRQYIILDAKTGSCLARANIELLKPGSTDMRIHTRYGVLDLWDKRLMERRTSKFGDDRFRIAHSAEHSNNWWIMCGDRRIVWIPHEFRTKYRPKVTRNTVVFRNERGGVIWLRFL